MELLGDQSVTDQFKNVKNLYYYYYYYLEDKKIETLKTKNGLKMLRTKLLLHNSLQTKKTIWL